MKHLLHRCLLIVSVSCAVFAGATPSTTGLKFIENKGQITDQYGNSRTDIDGKLAAGKGLNIFLGSGALHYQWVTSGQEQAAMYRMDVTLLGADPHARRTMEQPLPCRERYYLPSADNVIAGSFRRVVYHDIYPHIDWVLYTTSGGSFKYDFVVRPGGDPANIRLQYGGTNQLSLDKNGNCSATTPSGTITEQAPVSYEQQSGRNISSHFHLAGDVLSFQTGAYQGTLVIDPSIAWGTYFGGGDYDDMNGVAVGKNGFVYAVGSTNSTGNIATTGAYQTTFAGGANSGGSDALLCKFDPAGNLVWSTYYGGADADLGKKVAIDTAGGIYIAGWAGSTTGIATSGSYQPARVGGADRYNAFVVKFDTAGQRVWGTYCGGSNDATTTNPLDLCADNSGNIFLAFTTESTGIVTTNGAHQATLNGYDNAFLVKFNADGQVAWATYYGGETADYPYAIATDISGNLYLAGRSQSVSGIATSGAYQVSNNGSQDAFLSKFSPNGQLLWGTYYGGLGLDRGYGVTADSLGQVYLAGITNSASGIATPGSYQPTLAANDGFLAKFNTNGQRIWGTYYGGAGSESIWALHAATNNSIYCTGQTSSTGAIATSEGLQQTFSGSVDILLSKFDSSGTLAWGSYLGGQDAEVGFALRGDAEGHLYLCGRTNSAAGIATGSGYQGSFAGGTYDGFLIKINDCNLPIQMGVIDGPDIVCAGSTHTYAVSFTGAASYHWDIPDSWTGNSPTDHIPVTFNGQSGVLRVTAGNACGISDTATIGITVNPMPDTPVVSRNNNQLSVTASYASYQWNKDGQPINGAAAAAYTANSNGIYTVTVSNEQGCSVTSAPVDISITGIGSPLSERGIYVYPNPTTGDVRIYLPEACEVWVSGMDGRLMQRRVLPKGTHTISLERYAAGLYLVQVRNERGTFIGTAKISKTE